MTQRDPALLAKLSDIERSILAMLAQGHTAKTIAVQMGRSVGSINERLREARRKTGASSSRELARWLSQENSDDFIGMAPPVFIRPAPARTARSGRRETGTVIVILAIVAAAALSLTQHQSSERLPYDPLTDSFMEPTDVPAPLREQRAKLSTETRDAEWAPQAESMLRLRYGPTLGAAGPDASLRVTCARTLCEIAGVLPPVREQRINAAMQAFQAVAFSDAGIIKQSGVAFKQTEATPSGMTVLAYWSGSLRASHNPALSAHPLSPR